MKSCALHSTESISAHEIFDSLKAGNIDWTRLEIEPEGTIYGESQQLKWFRFYPDEKSSYEEVGGLDFYHNLAMPYFWDIEFKSGVALNFISECLRVKHHFVVVNDYFVIFSPAEIKLRAERNEEWWYAKE